MLRKYLDFEKIKQAYIGDATWLIEITEQLEKIKTNVEQEETRIYQAKNLIDMLWKMNYVVCETEDYEYAGKYYEQAHDLYSEMKIDLTEMLGIADMWEEI